MLAFLNSICVSFQSTQDEVTITFPEAEKIAMLLCVKHKITKGKGAYGKERAVPERGTVTPTNQSLVFLLLIKRNFPTITERT